MRNKEKTSLRSRLLLAIGAMTAVSMYGSARADAPSETKTECIPPNEAGECPSDDDALTAIEKKNTTACYPAIATPGATMTMGECCYEVRYDCYTTMGCTISGRPLIIEGRPLEGAARRISGWHDARLPQPNLTALSADERQILAVHWARVGAAEFASVAGFQRFAMDLMANGAPADLITDAHRAALDEVRHAKLAFTLASAFAGAPIGPAALDLPAAVPVHRSLAELAIATAEEGATVETFSVALLAEARAGATDPAVVAALKQMQRDEDRHAELAWRTLAWALSQDPSIADVVNAALKRAIAGLAADGFARTGGLEPFGLIHPSRAESCRLDTIRGVIEPCRAALFATSVSDSPS